MLHVCVQRFDVMENHENFWELNKALVKSNRITQQVSDGYILFLSLFLNFLDLATVTLSFVFDNYCLIMN